MEESKLAAQLKLRALALKKAREVRDAEREAMEIKYARAVSSAHTMFDEATKEIERVPQVTGTVAAQLAKARQRLDAL